MRYLNQTCEKNSKLFKAIFPAFFMRHSLEVGMSFGITSGIITTLGLMVGLNSGTHSKLAVLGGIITIAIADAFSDSLGIHVSEESENKHSRKQIWESTFFTFLSKFIFAIIFIIPILAFELTTAIIVSVVIGMCLLGIFSFSIAKREKAKPWKVVFEHLIIAVLVVIVTHYLGVFIGKVFV